MSDKPRTRSSTNTTTTPNPSNTTSSSATATASPANVLVKVTPVPAAGVGVEARDTKPLGNSGNGENNSNNNASLDHQPTPGVGVEGAGGRNGGVGYVIAAVGGEEVVTGGVGNGSNSGVLQQQQQAPATTSDDPDDPVGAVVVGMEEELDDSVVIGVDQSSHQQAAPIHHEQQQQQQQQQAGEDEEDEDADDDGELFDTQESPLFSRRCLTFTEVEKILLGEERVPKTKICTKIPNGEREKKRQSSTYVVDLAAVGDFKNVLNDALNPWYAGYGASATSGSLTRHYTLNGTGKATRVDKQHKLPKGQKSDLRIARTLYTNKSAKSLGGRLIRYIYRCLARNGQLRRFVVITFEWKTDIVEFEHLLATRDLSQQIVYPIDRNNSESATGVGNSGGGGGGNGDGGEGGSAGGSGGVQGDDIFLSHDDLIETRVEITRDEPDEDEQDEEDDPHEPVDPRCPLYNKKAILFDDVEKILLGAERVPKNLICHKTPTGERERLRRAGSYIVDLASLDNPNDILNDSLGSWQSGTAGSDRNYPGSGSRMRYYLLKPDGGALRVDKHGRKPPKEIRFDLKINRCLYTNRSAREAGGRLIRRIFRCFTRTGETRRFAVVNYEWYGKAVPFELLPPIKRGRKPGISPRRKSEGLSPNLMTKRKYEEDSMLDMSGNDELDGSGHNNTTGTGGSGGTGGGLVEGPSGAGAGAGGSGSNANDGGGGGGGDGGWSMEVVNEHDIEVGASTTISPGPGGQLSTAIAANGRGGNVLGNRGGALGPPGMRNNNNNNNTKKARLSNANSSGGAGTSGGTVNNSGGNPGTSSGGTNSQGNVGINEEAKLEKEMRVAQLQEKYYQYLIYKTTLEIRQLNPEFDPVTFEEGLASDPQSAVAAARVPQRVFLVDPQESGSSTGAPQASYVMTTSNTRNVPNIHNVYGYVG